MSEGFVKVTYSIKNILLIAVFFVFFIAMDAFLIFANPGTFLNSVFTIFTVFFTIYTPYMALNRIKKVSLIDGKLSIDRFLLKSLFYKEKSIKFISMDTLTIGKKTFNLRYVVNKSELIPLLLNTMEIKNIDEATNEILNGAHIYGNLEEINKAAKQINITVTVMTILIALLLIATVILNHWGIIFIICAVILVGFSYLKDFLFEERINKIKSKFLRLVSNGLINLVFIALTIVLGIVIYKIFMVWNIDLLKITV